MVSASLVGLGICSYLAFALIARKYDPLRHIPACGPSTPLLSWIGTLWYIFDSHGLLQRGYDRFPKKLFRIASPSKWMVIVGSQEYLEEVRKAPADVLSAHEGFNESLQSHYTFGETFLESEYHIPIIRNEFTRNLPAAFPNIADEVMCAIRDIFSDQMTVGIEGWTPFCVMQSIPDIVARITNRVFVGLPLCRDPEYIHIVKTSALNVVIFSSLLQLLPSFSRPYVSRLFRRTLRFRLRMAEILQPYIEERREAIDAGQSKSDMLTWLIQQADGPRQTTYELGLRIIAVNFAGIHTTSLVFYRALLHLADEPEAARLIREEVDALVKTEGWTYTAIKQMHRVDSFIKESIRFNALTQVLLQRMVMRPFTFSDGTSLPVGTYLIVPISLIHEQPTNYTDPHVFKPWRFLDEQEPIVKTTRTFLTFGHGPLSCPGRYFASAEMKMMMAYIAYTFDLKLPGKRPANVYIAGNPVPDKKAEILFRKRDIVEQ